MTERVKNRKKRKMKNLILSWSMMRFCFCVLATGQMSGCLPTGKACLALRGYHMGHTNEWSGLTPEDDLQIPLWNHHPPMPPIQQLRTTEHLLCDGTPPVKAEPRDQGPSMVTICWKARPYYCSWHNFNLWKCFQYIFRENFLSGISEESGIGWLFTLSPLGQSYVVLVFTKGAPFCFKSVPVWLRNYLDIVHEHQPQG